MQIKSQFTDSGNVAQVVYDDCDSFDHLLSKNVTQVYAVSFLDDKMLVVHNKHAWGLVGGGLEPNETYEECLKREIKEESNMRVLSFAPIGAQEVQFDGKIIYQLRYACIIQPYGDFVSDPDGDVSEIKLIDPKDYRQYFDWGEVGERIVQRAIELKNTVLKHKKVKSFGIIPIFKDKDDYKILIVQNSKGGHWGLPKGTPEKGEEPIETAKRELFEETGIKDTKIEPEKIFIEPPYSFEMYGITYEKTNSYFISFVDQMTKGNDLDEIDEIRWVSFDEARKTLTNNSVIKVVDELGIYLIKK
jgi:8-oxo-dGTP pyrophosphatase MutT (NUDIX family)